jgi:hypothetical protein
MYGREPLRFQSLGGPGPPTDPAESIATISEGTGPPPYLLTYLFGMRKLSQKGETDKRDRAREGNTEWICNG